MREQPPGPDFLFLNHDILLRQKLAWKSWIFEKLVFKNKSHVYYTLKVFKPTDKQALKVFNPKKLSNPRKFSNAKMFLNLEIF